MMTFAEADAQFEGLRRRYQTGALTSEQYDAELRQLMVMDGAGRWWAKARESGVWHYYDTTADRWVPTFPPDAPGETAQPPGGEAGAPANGPGSDPASGPANDLRPAGSIAPAGPYTSLAGPYSSPNPLDLADPPVQPALTSGIKILFALFSLLIPLLGIVLFFVYRRKPQAADRAAARLFLALGVISLVLSCLCTSLLMVAIQSTLFNWGP